jgi:hypothetical protein
MALTMEPDFEEAELWEDAATLYTIKIKYLKTPNLQVMQIIWLPAFMIQVIYDFPIFVQIWLLAAFQTVQLFRFINERHKYVCHG